MDNTEVEIKPKKYVYDMKKYYNKEYHKKRYQERKDQYKQNAKNRTNKIKETLKLFEMIKNAANNI
jgi:hypothetical protein